MNSVALLEQLQQQQQCVLNHCIQTQPNYKTQYHPDLSPAGWHLGHCIFTENYWVKEILLALADCDEALKSLYIPENSPKTERGKALPEYHDLCEWAENTQTENRKLLRKVLNNYSQHELMHNDYLIKFLIQHYAQHYETLQIISAQAALAKIYELIVKDPLQSSQLTHASRMINKGQYQIGATSKFEPYDNEHPDHKVVLGDTQIAVNPVTNSEYLCFMEAGAYETTSYWSKGGWLWCQQNAMNHPEYWQRDSRNNWYGTNCTGAFELHANDPVYGINHFEAEAFACWANARLPHEYEWEVADQQGLLQNTGKVWEWCANTFHPYDGFRAFPYEGYSTPYFDDKHYVLKGGSMHTQTVIRRASFRNYYQADKRHLFAGMRLVFE